MPLFLGTVLLSVALGSETPMPRIRTQDPVIAAAIREGLDLSATFRRLVEAIHSTDGIVYVGRGACREGATGCLRFGSVSGPNRVLHITLSPPKRDVDVGTIAHELQHVLEVLENPRITSPVAMTSFYLRVGVNADFTSRSRETAAATAAGNAVRAEMRSAQRQAERTRAAAGASDVMEITALP